ncbi:uncharacterized protein LOC143180314 [Calliopsis andreniformis]|uniref:uncharacterized protein LOC143180314 n=1 Tax=Calliopsis andreniformis TaxID=337506 RepID=UPI003FCD151E
MLKARKKKRKGKGKKEKKVKKKCMDERETLSYEQEILDNNRQLARLRSRNEELEEEAVTVKEKFRQLEQDRSDVIAHLKRNLEEKVEEARELNERLSALEELRKDELAAYKKKEESMELEYRTMENNLSAEVKLAAGKLNALEDWRLARLDLMQKYETQEKEMSELEQRLKDELYEAEKSVIIGKAMMKKEMAERLDILAYTLSKATNLRVAETTHRAIRENIALNHELDKILKSCRELEISSKETKEKERLLRLQCELFETESKISSNVVMKQRDTIHTLVNDIEMLLIHYQEAQRNSKRLEQYEILAEDLKNRNEKVEQKIQLLKKYIVKVQSDKEELYLKVHEKEEELCALRTILSRAKSCIKEALQLEGDITNENYCAEHLKQQLLSCLWEILENENILNVLKHTPSEVENIDCPYEKGCLGLIDSPKTKQEIKHDLGEVKEEEVPQFEEAEAELTELLEEKLPSCIFSDISSNIQSPKDSVTDNTLENE